MEYIYSIFVGLMLSVILWIAPIFTGYFSSNKPWILYVGLALYVPFLDLGIPIFPYVLISAVISFFLFNINDKYSQSSAMSDAPEWAARCQISYFFLVITSYIISWITA